VIRNQIPPFVILQVKDHDIIGCYLSSSECFVLFIQIFSCHGHTLLSISGSAIDSMSVLSDLYVYDLCLAGLADL